jgi:hypothetical protein
MLRNTPDTRFTLERELARYNEILHRNEGYDIMHTL